MQMSGLAGVSWTEQVPELVNFEQGKYNNHKRLLRSKQTQRER